MWSVGPILKPTGNNFSTILADIDRKKFDLAFDHIFYENHAKISLTNTIFFFLQNYIIFQDI